ncbi:uncharacterized protein K452DRAFT_318259 [Neofusicoccum parvum]|uniref:Uncharacterized protein K452DRAFT_318259 n=1 Tax=Neofusicoccum parvum TaxID=310453 RepID=A0ACB5RTQ6_9PEZI|nr:uncharacterized protein K452DRAFT_318259 [Neofusicoccum parvum]
MENLLLIEMWTEYAIGMAFHFLRLFTRLKTVGFQEFQMDDYFAMAGMVLWTLQTTLCKLMTIYGYNTGLTTETALLVPDSQLPSLVLGSKIAFGVWITYICYVWSLKIVLLSLYRRVTMGLWQQKLVTFMYGACAVTFTACIVTHFSICRPVHKNWQVRPYPGDNCAVHTPLYYVVSILNVTTDLGILVIPFPILFKARIPVGQKIVLGILFSSGIFVIVATILRAYYCIKSIETLTIAFAWASRETCVATVAVCCPSIKPLFSRVRWFTSASNSKSGTSGLGKGSRHFTGGGYDLPHYAGQPRGAERLSSSADSEIHMIRSDIRHEAESSSTHSVVQENEIHVKHEYKVQVVSNH